MSCYSHSDIKSIIHNHSNWSDGSNTVEEMANECIKRGYEYFVISDHSKSAFYAKGLSEERIREQHKYIDELNKKLKPFKIFKSIECDILNDGSMDYTDDVLATFDLGYCFRSQQPEDDRRKSDDKGIEGNIQSLCYHTRPYDRPPFIES